MPRPLTHKTIYLQLLLCVWHPGHLTPMHMNSISVLGARFFRGGSFQRFLGCLFFNWHFGLIIKSFKLYVHIDWRMGVEYIVELPFINHWKFELFTSVH